MWLHVPQSRYQCYRLYNEKHNRCCRCLFLLPPHPFSVVRIQRSERKTVGFYFMRQVQKHALSSATHLACHSPGNLGALALITSECMTGELCEGARHIEDGQQMFAGPMDRLWQRCFFRYTVQAAKVCSSFATESELRLEQGQQRQSGPSASRARQKLHMAFQVLENKIRLTSQCCFLFPCHDCHSWRVTETGH